MSAEDYFDLSDPDWDDEYDDGMRKREVANAVAGLFQPWAPLPMSRRRMRKMTDESARENEPRWLWRFLALDILIAVAERVGCHQADLKEWQRRVRQLRDRVTKG